MDRIQRLAEGGIVDVGGPLVVSGSPDCTWPVTALKLHSCEACGAEYTSILAAYACEDEDRENRFDQ